MEEEEIFVIQIKIDEEGNAVFLTDLKDQPSEEIIQEGDQQEHNPEKIDEPTATITPPKNEEAKHVEEHEDPGPPKPELDESNPLLPKYKKLVQKLQESETRVVLAEEKNNELKSLSEDQQFQLDEIDSKMRADLEKHIEELQNAQTEIETIESVNGQQAEQVKRLQRRVKDFQERRSNSEIYLQQEKIKAKKLNDENMNLQKQLAEMTKRAKEAVAQNTRLKKDVEKLDASVDQRDELMKKSLKKIKLQEADINRLLKEARTKDQHISKLQTNIADSKKEGEKQRGGGNFQTKQTSKLMRELEMKDNEIAMMKAMIKSWTVQVRGSQQAEAPQRARGAPVKLPAIGKEQRKVGRQASHEKIIKSHKMIGGNVKFNDPGLGSPEFSNSPKSKVPRRKATPAKLSKFNEIQESVEELEGSYAGDSPDRPNTLYAETPVDNSQPLSGSYDDAEEQQDLNIYSQDEDQDEKDEEQEQDEEAYEHQAKPVNVQESPNATFGDDLDIDLDTPSPDLAHHLRKDLPPDYQYESPSFAQDIHPQDSLQFTPGSDNQEIDDSPTNVDQDVAEEPANQSKENEPDQHADETLGQEYAETPDLYSDVLMEPQQPEQTNVIFSDEDDEVPLSNPPAEIVALTERLAEDQAHENEGMNMADDINPNPEHLDELAAPADTAQVEVTNELGHAEEEAPLGDVSFENDVLDKLELL